MASATKFWKESSPAFMIDILQPRRPSRGAELRQPNMRTRPYALIDRAHDLLGIVFQELLDTLRIHSSNIEIRGMMYVHRAYAGRVGSAGHDALCPWRHAGGDDHLAAMRLHDHVAWQAPGALRKAAGDR